MRRSGAGSRLGILLCLVLLCGGCSAVRYVHSSGPTAVTLDEVNEAAAGARTVDVVLREGPFYRVSDLNLGPESTRFQATHRTLRPPEVREDLRGWEAVPAGEETRSVPTSEVLEVIVRRPGPGLRRGVMIGFGAGALAGLVIGELTTGGAVATGLHVAGLTVAGMILGTALGAALGSSEGARTTYRFITRSGGGGRPEFFLLPEAQSP